MNRIALMCDSSADITKEEAAALDIHVVRMPIVIDGKDYKEELEISDREFIEAMRSEKRITTTQPSLGDFILMWEELLKEYDEIIFLVDGGIEMAGSYNAVFEHSEKFREFLNGTG